MGIRILRVFVAVAAAATISRASGSQPGAANATAGVTSPPTLSFVSITAGQDHTCGLTASGDAYCWGSNSNGQLGAGDPDNARHETPLLVSGGHRFRDISAGFLHTCALDAAWQAYCWGSNEYGQLGVGSRTGSFVPLAVSGGLTFQSLSSGATHTCGLAQGVAYCWGGNWHGQIGDGSFDGDAETACCRKVPVAVRTELRFSMISTGGISTCAVGTDRHGYCWGNGSDGRLGIHAGDLRDRNRPTRVATNAAVTAISARGHHACLLDDGGRGFCWGEASQGQLATLDTNVTERTDAPVPVAAGLVFTHIQVGMYHTCGAGRDTHLYCWGSNRFREATGDSEGVRTPKALFPRLAITSVAIGGNDFSGHSCALTTAGRALCWGDNRKGQLGEFAALSN